MVITIVSGNPRKADFFCQCLAGIGVRTVRMIRPLDELQADSIESVARNKAVQAMACASPPLLVEDAGLVIDCLQGFPGPVTRYVLETVGPEGLLKIAGASACAIESFTVLVDSRKGEHLFVDRIEGTLAVSTDDIATGAARDLLGIFIPKGERLPFSGLEPERREAYVKHRCDRFVAWFRK